MTTIDATPQIQTPRPWTREWADAQPVYCDRVAWLKRSPVWPCVAKYLALTGTEVATLQPPKVYTPADDTGRRVLACHPDNAAVGCGIEYTLMREDGTVVGIAVNEDGTRAAVSVDGD